MKILRRGNIKTKRDVNGVPATVRASSSFPTDIYESLESVAREKKVSLVWVVRDTSRMQRRVVLDAAWQRSKHRNPRDLVFTNAKGGPVNRRNLLNRHLKPTIKKLALLVSVDFRSFRTMHSSLMSSIGVRPEVTRDNMGHRLWM